MNPVSGRATETHHRTRPPLVCTCFKHKEDRDRELLTVFVLEAMGLLPNERQLTDLEREYLEKVLGLNLTDSPLDVWQVDNADLQRRMRRMAECPEHAHRKVPLIPGLGRFWFVKGPTGYRVRRESFGTLDVNQLAKTDAFRVRGQILEDTIVSDDVKAHIQVCGEVGFAFAVKEDIRPPPVRGQKISEKSILWPRYGYAACPLCNTATELRHFFNFWNAASYQLFIAPKSGTIQVRRMALTPAKLYCSGRRTTSCRAAIHDGSGDCWVVSIAKPGTFGDSINRPQELWNLVFKPPVVRAYGNLGSGWADPVVQHQRSHRSFGQRLHRLYLPKFPTLDFLKILFDPGIEDLNKSHRRLREILRARLLTYTGLPTVAAALELYERWGSHFTWQLPPSKGAKVVAEVTPDLPAHRLGLQNGVVLLGGSTPTSLRAAMMAEMFELQREDAHRVRRKPREQE